MNFGTLPSQQDELEINLIPLIDLLLVILIFLAATTSFTHFTQLRVQLPQAQNEQAIRPNIEISISQDNHYALNGQLLDITNPNELVPLFKKAIGQNETPILVINADAQATHQSIIYVMQAARLAHINRVNFAAQTSP